MSKGERCITYPYFEACGLGGQGNLFFHLTQCGVQNNWTFADQAASLRKFSKPKGAAMKFELAFKFPAVRLLFAALVLPAFTVRAGGNYLNGSAFIKGANLPWFEDVTAANGYYNDIAVNPHPSTGSGCIYNSAQVSNYLADLHKMGVPVVRFWLTTDDQGCTLDANGYVTGVTNQLWTNLDNLLSIAGSNGISLYLTLSEGRFDWLTNTAMANAYKTNCLIPLIQRYKGSTNVFGIDLMNELDNWVADPFYGNPWISSGATWAQAKTYITNFAAAIHSADSNRLVSCSQVYHNWTNLTYWKGLGLDFYDFHYYADSISLPAVSTLGMDKPVWVGECGQAYGDYTWSDSLQSNCELEALNTGYSGGYAGVSIWSYALPDWQTTDYIQYAMLNTNGTWRQVCYTIQNWTPASVPVASPNLVIYDDSLQNGFQQGYSWATVNYDNTSPVYSGSDSISVTTASSYNALWLYHDNFSTAPYASLSFWINGGASGATGLQVLGVTNSEYVAAYNLPTLPANTWLQFNIPLSALGVSNIANCEGFWFWPTLSGATTFYVDSIQMNVATPSVLTVVSAKPKTGSFALQLSGLSGRSYWIETSTNLVNWTSVSTNTLTYSSLNITNSVNASSSRQFWRAY